MCSGEYSRTGYRCPSSPGWCIPSSAICGIGIAHILRPRGGHQIGKGNPMRRTRITRVLRAAAAAAAVTSLALAGATSPATAAPHTTSTAAGPPRAAWGRDALTGPGSARQTADPVTAYIADAGSDTVTPILAATNTAGHPITV